MSLSQRQEVDRDRLSQRTRSVMTSPLVDRGTRKHQPISMEGAARPVQNLLPRIAAAAVTVGIVLKGHVGERGGTLHPRRRDRDPAALAVDLSLEVEVGIGQGLTAPSLIAYVDNVLRLLVITRSGGSVGRDRQVHQRLAEVVERGGGERVRTHPAGADAGVNPHQAVIPSGLAGVAEAEAGVDAEDHTADQPHARARARRVPV